MTLLSYGYWIREQATQLEWPGQISTKGRASACCPPTALEELGLIGRGIFLLGFWGAASGSGSGSGTAFV